MVRSFFTSWVPDGTICVAFATVQIFIRTTYDLGKNNAKIEFTFPFFIFISFFMKKAYNYIIILLSMILCAKADLQLNCPHILRFTDNEINWLRSIVSSLNVDTCSYKKRLDISVFKKYFPQHMEKNLQQIKLSDSTKQSILEILIEFESVTSDFGLFSLCYKEFAYLLLITMYEKIKFPPYTNNVASSAFQPYYSVTSSLHNLVQFPIRNDDMNLLIRHFLFLKLDLILIYQKQNSFLNL